VSAVLVIGGTGTTGSRVAAMLRDRNATVRIATRKPSEPDHVLFDWADPATHGPALASVDSIYLISPIGVAEPVPIVEPFLNLARGTGARRAVLLSSSAVNEDSGLGALHRTVRTAMPEWAVLRPSWFMQNFLGEHMLASGIRDHGEIVTATGDGRVPFIDATDIAAVATHALLDPLPHNAEHILTGPEALSYTEAAAIISEITGQPVRHRSITAEEFTTRLVTGGIPAPFAEVLAALDENISHGAENRISTTVPDITGRPARPFREFIAANRKAIGGVTAAR
jgi:uncharacterized protein YbjT (DUF2867 family)